MAFHAGSLDIGAALRKKYEQDHAEEKAQKTMSRLSRWQAREKLKCDNYAPLDTEVKANQFWLLVASPVAVLLVQTLGVFQKYKNSFKPFQRVPLSSVDRVQLRVFIPTGRKEGEWQHADYVVCRASQQMVCCLPADSVRLDLKSRIAITCGRTNVTIAQLRPLLPNYCTQVLGMKGIAPL